MVLRSLIMTFKYQPYQETGDKPATTNQGGGGFKYTPYQEKKTTPMINGKPYLIPNLELVKQTPEKSVGQKVGEIFFPDRGFTEEQMIESKPTFKEKAVGAGKYAGELVTGISSLSSAGLRRVPGLRWLAGEEEDIKKAQEWFAPSTAGQAKVMRDIDVYSSVVPVAASIRGAGKIDLLRDAIIKRFDEGVAPGIEGRPGRADILGETDAEKAAQEIAERLKNNTNPTIDDINEGLEALRVTGRQSSDLAQAARDVQAPPTYTQRAGSSDIQPARVPSGKQKTARFAEGAKSMFEGAKFNTAKVTPRSTAALAEQAQEIVQNAEKADLENIINRNDDLGTATASEYLNKLSREYETASAARKTEIALESADIANRKADRLAEAGREIQAASLLSRLTPEGQLRYVANEIKRYNRKAPDNKKIPELTPEQSKQILDEMDEIRRTENPLERRMKFFELQKKVQGMIPSSNLRKLTQLWKAGLLTGIKTSGLNIFSNASHLVTETISGLAAAGFDRVFSVFTGQRTTAATMRGALNGIKEGTVKGKRYFFSGFDERNLGEKLDYKRVNFGKGGVGRVLQAYTDQVFQTIGAQDQPFYYSALARSYMDQALATAMNEGLKGKAAVKRAYQIVEEPTEEMMENAVRDATTAVFMNDTVLGDVAQWMQKTPIIGQFIIPFAKTPSAVATQIMNYTPTGAVTEVIKQIYKGKFDQRALSKALGRSTLGTVPMYIGWQMAGDGRVSLQYPSGDTRQIELDKAEGVAYNSVKVGDEWRNPIALGPAGLLILMGAHIRVAMEKSGSANEAVVNGALGLYETLTEQTFLTGLTNFTSMIEDLQTSGKSTFGNFVASFIPTIVSDVARATDTAERQAETTVERMARRIPGARQRLEPKVDILGREQAIAGRGGEFLPDFIESMADPTRPSQDVSTKVTAELSRLQSLSNDKTGDTYRVVPTRNGLYGYEVLTDKQETQLQKYAGQIINQKLTNLFLDERYLNAPDEAKAEIINDITKASKDAARARMVLEIVQTIPPERRQRAIVRMYEDGLITRDVERILDGS